MYKLKKDSKGYKRGTEFYLIAASEFIGVKEFTLRTKDLGNGLTVNENELLRYFFILKN